ERDGGTLVSRGGDVSVSPDYNVTWYAHWSIDQDYVTYDCDDGDGGTGGTGQDTEHPVHYNGSYTVLQNMIVNGGVVDCHKDADVSAGRRYHVFENWTLNLNNRNYQPGYLFNPWTFTVDNPTFNANYKECPNGWYFDGSCKQCPYGYPYSNTDATLPQHCYKKDCELPCAQVCPPREAQEPGVLGCTYTTVNYTGTEYYEGSCNAAVQNCSWRVWCNEGAG
ncbi:MAG: hypothetical protein IJO18_01735, partial [Alphaproteobacteria bacterium]|nr:hypothetical protein [Alphaproteobacteria bacterium]